MDRSVPVDATPGCRLLVLALCALLIAGVCQARTPRAQTAQAAQAAQHTTGTQAAHGWNAPDPALWMAASDRTLDRMRGGFDLGSGLVVSFGIQREVSVNGQLILSSSFQLRDLTGLTSPQAAALGRQIAAQSQVVNNGAGNTLDPGAAAIPAATYIQNTLNNQTIRNQIIIDATSNAMGIAKGLNLQATINEAIAQAIGTR